MKESTKSVARRLKDSRFASRYLTGNGIDIGGKPDPLSLHLAVFPNISSVKIWDLEDGDAQYMNGVPGETFDFVYSSHTLEHMQNATEALSNWFRILKPGGHLIISVPDEDLYEQGDFKNKFNKHHKHTFTIHKVNSWSIASVNILDLIASLGDRQQICLINLEDTHYRYDLPRFDQTRAPLTESAIEFVVRKRHIQELKVGGRLPSASAWPVEAERHYFQYELDQRAASQKYPEPFGETK
jgi:SAM-dependent methyltransferase